MICTQRKKMLTLSLNTVFQFLNIQLLLLIWATLLTTFNNIVHLFDLETNPNSNCGFKQSIQGLSKSSSFFTLFLSPLVTEAPSTSVLCGSDSAVLALPAVLQEELKPGSSPWHFDFPLEGSWRLFLCVVHISPQPHG